MHVVSQFSITDISKADFPNGFRESGKYIVLLVREANDGLVDFGVADDDGDFVWVNQLFCTIWVNQLFCTTV